MTAEDLVEGACMWYADDPSYIWSIQQVTTRRVYFTSEWGTRAQHSDPLKRLVAIEGLCVGEREELIL